MARHYIGRRLYKGPEGNVPISRARIKVPPGPKEPLRMKRHLLALPLLLAALPAFAQNPPPAPPLPPAAPAPGAPAAPPAPTPPVQGEATLGYQSTKGNTDTESANGTFALLWSLRTGRTNSISPGTRLRRRRSGRPRRMRRSTRASGRLTAASRISSRRSTGATIAFRPTKSRRRLRPATAAC